MLSVLRKFAPLKTMVCKWTKSDHTSLEDNLSDGIHKSSSILEIVAITQNMFVEDRRLAERSLRDTLDTSSRTESSVSTSKQVYVR